MSLSTVAQAFSISLAVSSFSAENQTYETQTKISNHGRSRREARSSSGAGVVEVHSGRKSRKTSQDQAVHLFREEERARQSFKILSSSSGSSPRLSKSIAAITSASFVNPSIVRIASNRSFCNLRASALAGRLPRRDSSAITSRMSSSFAPLVMFEARNDSGSLLTIQLSSLANTGMRLTRKNAPAYTVDSRWACNFARRASSHSACSVGNVFRPPEFPKSADLSGRC